jgi:hypothetical protein
MPSGLGELNRLNGPASTLDRPRRPATALGVGICTLRFGETTVHKIAFAGAGQVKPAVARMFATLLAQRAYGNESRDVAITPLGGDRNQRPRVLI